MEQCDCVQTRRTLVSLHLLDLQPLSSDILMNVPLRQYKVTLTAFKRQTQSMRLPPISGCKTPGLRSLKPPPPKSK